MATIANEERTPVPRSHTYPPQLHLLPEFFVLLKGDLNVQLQREAEDGVMGFGVRGGKSYL